MYRQTDGWIDKMVWRLNFFIAVIYDKLFKNYIHKKSITIFKDFIKHHLNFHKLDVVKIIK